MKGDTADRIGAYIDALYPVIYINHFDFKTIDELIKSVKGDRKVEQYVHGIGMVGFGNNAIMKPCKLVEFLHFVKDDGYDNPTLIVLKDIHKSIDTPEVISLIRYIAERNMHVEGYNATILILSSSLVIPHELEEIVTIYDFPLPSENEISEVISNFCADMRIPIESSVKDELALSLKGLNEFQITQILNLAYQDGGYIDVNDRNLILKQKEQLIKKAGLLEMVRVKETIDDIGGLDNLKHWLENKSHIFKELDRAIKYGVDVPKGILIVGMPGCGKSLTAKATSALFDIPLVRLDVGRLLGKYIGESEDNMNKALKLAEAISPCVLWVDELEKAFAGIGGAGGGSDVTTRLFGQFLTWMQEKENTVFIVATANDISKIPPEFLRKGRFDELFSVELPDASERKRIIEIHLRRRGKWNTSININALIKETDGYSGSDLEAIVKDAIEKCYIEEKEDITIDDLLEAKLGIKSIKETMQDKIEDIGKALEKMQLKPANITDSNNAVTLVKKSNKKHYIKSGYIAPECI